KHHLLHRNGASYQARALGDSATVTRIDDSSLPGRPRPPERAASANRSWTYLVRNSVVVFTPLNWGRSSRLRYLSGLSAAPSTSWARPISTTMPFSSSRSDMNAARTTKVAPCNSCAGPNTAPRNEWAIMIWSETSTAYKEHLRSPSCAPSLRIADERATCVRVRRKKRRQAPRQVREIDGRREQRVEGGIVEQREGSRQPLMVRPARPMGCSDLADLTGNEPQAPAVER